MEPEKFLETFPKISFKNKDNIVFKRYASLYKEASSIIINDSILLFKLSDELYTIPVKIINNYVCKAVIYDAMKIFDYLLDKYNKIIDIEFVIYNFIINKKTDKAILDKLFKLYLICDDEKIIENKILLIPYACKYNNLSALEYFIEQKLDINYNNLPISYSLANNNIDMIKLLFEQDIDTDNPNKNMMFIHMIIHNKFDIFKLFINRGYEITDAVPLIEACRYNRTDMAIYIIDISATDIPQIAIDLAIQNGNIDLANYLTR